MRAVQGSFPARLLLVSIASVSFSPADEVPSLSERTGTRLAQLDVTLSGPPEAIATVGREDFEVFVGGRKVPDFILDPVCTPETAGSRTGGPDSTPEEQPPAVRPATFLLYFDGPHLTMAGRQRAIDAARELLPGLLAGGHRAMILSNGRDLVTLQPLTPDVGLLDAALERLEQDRAQWDPWSAVEELRVRELEDLLREKGAGAAGSTIDRALSMIQSLRGEELWRVQRNLGRLGMVLGRFAEVDPPKAVLYFADTMRSNAGEHYLRYLGESVRGKALLRDSGKGDRDNLSKLLPAGGAGDLPFDAVLNQAAALGIRFYTVQAQGMTESSGRVRDAQNTLASFALETGGQHFLNGVTPKKILGRMRQDMGCLYLVSFDPAGFPEDEPLPVRVTVDVPGVKVQVRGRLVLHSPAARTTTRLLAAFSTTEAPGPSPIRAALIPLGYDKGEFRALLQVFVPATEVPGAVWDLGASVVSMGKVRQEAAGRITVGGKGVPVVLEKEMALDPGPYEIVAVAREETSDRILSIRVESRLEDPDGALASVAPISVLQPEVGAFSREGAVKKSGTLAYGPEHSLQAGRPTALVSLVCRAKQVSGPLRVERSLVGESTVNFEPVEMEFAGERCAQVRDVIPGGTLGDGDYRYLTVVRERGTEVGRAERLFRVLAPAP